MDSRQGQNFMLNSIQRFAAAFAVFLSVALVIIDGTIVTVGLPVMARSLDVSDNLSIWIVNSYQLILLSFLFPATSMVRKTGTRKVFLAGIVIFTAASLGCALSPSFAVLIVLRLVQALGGSAILSVNLSLVERVFPDDLLPRGVALNTATISLSIIVAPALAGAILTVAPWPWLFVINLPLGLTAYLVARSSLPRAADGDEKADTPPLSAVALNACLFLAAFLLLGVPAYGLPFWMLPLAAFLLLVSATLFGRIERAAATPVYPLSLLDVRSFRLTTYCLVLCFMAQSGTVLALPFLLMERLSFPIAETSALLVCWPAAHILASLAFAFALRKISPHILCTAGMLVCAAGIAALTQCGPGSDFADLALRIGLCGLGFGLFQAPNDTLAMASAPAGSGHQTSAMLAFTRTLGQVLGAMATAGAFFWMPDAPALPCLLAALFALAGIGCLVMRQRMMRG